MNYEPNNPDYEARVRSSFDRQVAMETLGGSITEIGPGKVTLEMRFDKKLTQQHGFIHAGIVTAMLDSAAGYAAFSLMPAEAEVLTVELKTNLMAPAKGRLFRFEGQVIKPGRTITFTRADAYAINGNGKDTLFASMTATMMTLIGREGIKG